MSRDLIIKVIGDDTQLKPTLTTMRQMGAIDEKNAKQFESNQKKYNQLVSKNIGTLEKLRIKQAKIIELREKSTNPARIKRYNALLKKQQTEINKITEAGGKQVKQMNMLQSSIMNIGATMAAAFSVQQIISYSSELKRLSIQMEADNKKNAIVFADSLDYVTERAKENANAIGLTSNEYLRASASTQDLLVPLGFVRDEAAKMSTDLTDLSGALSVWSGGTRTATEVSEILTKTILGETEQIKTLGIKIDQTSPSFNRRIKEMMATNDVSLEQAKALEILNQITSKSVDAQNAFASGQKTLAQETAEANARLREQEEVLAVNSIPIWRVMNQVMIEYTTDLSDGIKKTTEFADLFKEMSKLNVWKSMGDGMKYTGENMVIMNHNFDKLFFDLGKPTGGGNAILGQTVDTLATLTTELTNMRTRLMGIPVASKEFKALSEEIAKAEQNLAKLTGKGEKGVAKGGEETLLEKLAKEAGTLKKQLQEQAIAGDISATTLTEYNTIVEVLTESQKKLNDAIAQEKENRNELLKFIEAEQLPMMEEIDEELILFWDKKEQGYTLITEKEAEKRKKIYENESRALKRGALDVVNQLSSTFSMYTDNRLAQVDALAKEEKISDDEAKERKNQILRESATTEKLFKSFSIITSTAQAVANALATIPPPFNIAVASTMGVLGAAQLAIVQQTPIPQFAKGTKGKSDSGMAIVGEEGEEAVFLPQGAKVLPHRQTKQYGDIIDAMYDNRLEAHILKNYVPRLMPKQQTQGQKDDGFIDKMIHGLGANDFNTDPVVNVLKKMDKNDNMRLEELSRIILKGYNKRTNKR